MPPRRPPQPLIDQLPSSQLHTITPSGIGMGPATQAQAEEQPKSGRQGAAEQERMGDDEDEAAESFPDPTMSQRLSKMHELRKRMTESQRANRKDVVDESRRSQLSAREAARLERKKAQAVALGEKTEAAAAGEDIERRRNWEWTIEDNEKWDKKLKRQQSRADQGLTNAEDLARRKYKKDIDRLKPDLTAYQRQRQVAQGMDPNSALVAGPSASGSITQQLAATALYRDGTTLAYADHKPSEDAIDRVVGKVNLDIDTRKKRSRVRNDDDEEITYINDKNKHFNKKIARFYNKYTEATRESFERGTAL